MIKMFPSLLAILALVASASAQCNLKTLQKATSAYVQTQLTGSNTTFFPILASNITYTENEKAMNIKTGILTQAMKIDHSRSIHDTVLCGTFTELIITNPNKPYVIGTKMMLKNDRVSLIERIVTKPGDWLFNATGYLHWDSIEKWDPIPLNKQDSRRTIHAAADTYFNRFNNINITVPFGTPCARLEGGAYTGENNLTANTCNLGLPSTIKVTKRRYVIDQTFGAVSMFLGFPGLDRSQGDTPMPDGHLFRVEQGKIKYIHTVSSCVQYGCGLNGTFPPRRMMHRWRESSRWQVGTNKISGQSRGVISC